MPHKTAVGYALQMTEVHQHMIARCRQKHVRRLQACQPKSSIVSGINSPYALTVSQCAAKARCCVPSQTVQANVMVANRSRSRGRITTAEGPMHSMQIGPASLLMSRQVVANIGHGRGPYEQEHPLLTQQNFRGSVCKRGLHVVTGA